MPTVIPKKDKILELDIVVVSGFVKRHLWRLEGSGSNDVDSSRRASVNDATDLVDGKSPRSHQKT